MLLSRFSLERGLKACRERGRDPVLLEAPLSLMMLSAPPGTNCARIHVCLERAHCFVFSLMLQIFRYSVQL